MADALIDSDVIIDVLRGPGGAAVWLADYCKDHALITSSVNLFEVARGWNSDNAGEAGLRLLREFLILPLDTAAALEASVIDSELRRAGAPLDAGDLLIAGVARANGLAIITRNIRHFGRIDGLEALEPPLS